MVSGFWKAAATLVAAQQAVAESEAAKKQAEAEHADILERTSGLTEEVAGQRTRIGELEAQQASTDVRLAEALDELERQVDKGLVARRALPALAADDLRAHTPAKGRQHVRRRRRSVLH